MTSTYFSLNGGGSGASASSPKAWSAANWTSALTAASTDDTIGFINTDRYPVSSVLSTITKRITVKGVKSDGTDPDWQAGDFRPVFYPVGVADGGALEVRAHPWPTDPVEANAAAPGDPCFRYSSNGPSFKNLIGINFEVFLKPSGSSISADVGSTVEDCKIVNCEGMLTTASRNDGRWTNGAMRRCRGAGYSRCLARVYPKTTYTIEDCHGEAAAQVGGTSAGTYPGMIIILEDHDTDNDRKVNAKSCTTQSSTTVLGNFYATEVGATFTGSGIQANTTITAVNPGVSATISQAATNGTVATRSVGIITAATSGNATVLGPFLPTDTGAGFGGSGIRDNAVLDVIVEGVSATMVDGTTLLPLTASGTSTVATRTIYKHGYLSSANAVVGTITRCSGFNHAGRLPNDDYPQGDVIIVEENIHPSSSCTITYIRTVGSGDRGIDTKCAAHVRWHSSEGDWRGIAQHRLKVFTSAGPLTLTPVEMLVEDSVYKEMRTGRIAAAGAQASGGMRIRRCLFRQVNGNTTDVALVRTDVNTVGPPYDYGAVVLERRCRLIKGSNVAQTSVAGSTTIDPGDSVTV